MGDVAYGPGRRLAAWGVHAYTALGLPLGVIAAEALHHGDAARFFACMWATCAIDATDGMLARKVRVKDVVPHFDGSLLDNLVDYLTFAFLPALALPGLGLVSGPGAWIAMLPVLASGYQFCQANAKTEDSFVGFPSYWNIVVLYLYVLHASPTVTIVVITVLSVLAFVPIHYLYPSKATFLRVPTFVLGGLWAVALVPVCFAPDAEWAVRVTQVSVLFPVYYLVASLVSDAKRRASLSGRAT